MILAALAALFLTQSYLVATLGDAATASLISGVFGAFNIALTALALRWINQGKHEAHNASSTASLAASAAAAASDSAADAAQAAAEACRVAKSIGSAIRHEDPLVVKRDPPEIGP